jgi:hypothetical protein
MDKCKIYIAGRIGGLTEDVYIPKFKDAELLLIKAGYEPINPVELPHLHNRSWKSYMIEDLNALKECGNIYMLDNWELSRGAKIEHWFAKRYNKNVIYQ